MCGSSPSRPLPQTASGGRRYEVPAHERDARAQLPALGSRCHTQQRREHGVHGDVLVDDRLELTVRALEAAALQLEAAGVLPDAGEEPLDRRRRAVALGSGHVACAHHAQVARDPLDAGQRLERSPRTPGIALISRKRSRTNSLGQRPVAVQHRPRARALGDLVRDLRAGLEQRREELGGRLAKSCSWSWSPRFRTGACSPRRPSFLRRRKERGAALARPPPGALAETFGLEEDVAPELALVVLAGHVHAGEQVRALDVDDAVAPDREAVRGRLEARAPWGRRVLTNCRVSMLSPGSRLPSRSSPSNADFACVVEMMMSAWSWFGTPPIVSSTLQRAVSVNGPTFSISFVPSPIVNGVTQRIVSLVRNSAADLPPSAPALSASLAWSAFAACRRWLLVGLSPASVALSAASALSASSALSARPALSA